MAISAIFNVSIDELFSNEKSIKRQSDFLYESVTEYDIEQAKRYDMKLGGANALVLSGYDGEKIRVRLASNTLSTLQKDFKVKIDDVKKRIDIDVFRKNGMTEAIAKETVMIFVQLPNQYIGKIEASVNSQSVELRSIKCDSIELDTKTSNVTLLDTKTSNVTLENVEGTVELNCNLDMDITCLTLNGSVEINQISATSRISVPSDAHFSAVAKGIGTSITFEKSGKKTNSFAEQESDNIIELNGMKSELVISAQD